MADEPAKDEQKSAKPAAAAKRSGLVPIIAAVGVLAAVGGGVGMLFAKSLTPAPVPKEEQAAAADPAGTDAATDPASAGLLTMGQELDPIDLKGNVTGSGGTRYLTMTVGLWVPRKDHSRLNDHSVRRLIQARMEETIKTYQLEDLQSPNIMARMRRDFTTAVERLLRSVLPGRPPEEKFVLEVTVTNLLTQ